MAVTSNNGTGTPAPFYGAMTAYADENGYYASTSRVAGTVTPTQKPLQVVGLVPVFPCCVDDSADASGGFRYADTDTDPLTSYIDIKIGTLDFGQFMTIFTDSNAVIQARINSLLNPSGFTATVTGINFANRIVTINAPAGTGDVYNGYSVTITITGGATLLATTTMQGGYDHSDPDCDCREGKYQADRIADSTQWTLPVFAQTATGSSVDPYKNDFNRWLFEMPAGAAPNSSYAFTLQEWNGSAWVDKASLNSNTYGTYYALGSLCANIMWTGYHLDWYKVIQAFGTGVYRFKVAITTLTKQAPCYASPPFCLKEYECYEINKTVKFEVTYAGGQIGSVEKMANCAARSWNFCCITVKSGTTAGTSNPITWLDSIRLPGFFGNEDKEIERTQIKYQTGFIKKVRDEAIRKFTFFSGSIHQTNPGAGWPFWVHDRMAVYGFMADQVLVSDYNLNNPDYSIKRYCVVLDSGYEPKYNFAKRYANVELKFKPQIQYLLRTRCC